MTDTDLKKQLKKISELLYGDKAELKIVRTKSLKLLDKKKNARYMEKQTQDQLTDNIRTDGFLASVPLCSANKQNKLAVLSGNHRVLSTIEAGIEDILVIEDKRPLTNEQKISIQLSHNSLTGKDDEAILARLWQEISSVKEKLYAGLDSKLVEKLENEKYKAFNPAQIPTKQLTFWFLPSDIENIEKIFENGILITGDSTHVVSYADYDRIVKMIIAIKKKKNIKNSAIAFNELLNLAEIKLKENNK